MFAAPFARVAAIGLLGAMLSTLSCSKGGTGVVDDEEPSPPSRVTDLTVTQVTSASVTLRWTAPTGGTGSMMAASYDLRCAAAAIDASNWAAALEIEGEPAPLFGGEAQTMVIAGVPADTTLYFALKAIGSNGLWSALSNSALASVPPESGIVFADAALEAAIRLMIQKPQGTLMPSDVAALDSLQVNDGGIGSLEGLQFCASLRWLGLHGNAIADLGPIAGLGQLRDLDLSGNRVVDLSPLAGHASLVNLILADNAIEDVGPLHGLAMLNVLNLNQNHIARIDSVAGCWRLNHLFLADNVIQDLGPLTALIYLANLDLAGNRIEDLAPLVANAGMGAGDQIWLARNPLSDVARNEQIPALRARGAVIYER